MNDKTVRLKKIGTGPARIRTGENPGGAGGALRAAAGACAVIVIARRRTGRGRSSQVKAGQA